MSDVLKAISERDNHLRAAKIVAWKGFKNHKSKSEDLAMMPMTYEQKAVHLVKS
jgi:hypothetical protein